VSSQTIRLGVSSCLLGEAVRYDGGHKYEGFVNEVLGRFFEWVPVCPEVEIGLGTPREKIHLVRVLSEARLLKQDTRVDITGRMTDFSGRRGRELEDVGIHGYVFKSESPSCGPSAVPIHDPAGRVVDRGPGLFAKGLIERSPRLPVASEVDLGGIPTRMHFVERVYAHYRWHEFVKTSPELEDLAAFHGRHEEVLHGHHADRCDRLRQSLDGAHLSEDLTGYGEEFLGILALTATREHLEGALGELLGADRELLALLRTA